MADPIPSWMPATLQPVRAQARAALLSSPLYLTWKAASAAFTAQREDVERLLSSPASSPELELTLEDVDPSVDAASLLFERQEPLVARCEALSRLLAQQQRVAELRREVEAGDEWRRLKSAEAQLREHLRREAARLSASLNLGTGAVVQHPPPSSPPSAGGLPADGRAPSQPPSAAGVTKEEARDAPPPTMPPSPASTAPPPSAADIGSPSPSPPLAVSSSEGGPPSSSSSLASSVASPMDERKDGDDESDVDSAPAAASIAAKDGGMRFSVAEDSCLSVGYKRDDSSQLRVPSWNCAVQQDALTPVPERGLGLCNAAVHRDMCGTEKHQLQRVWSRPSAHPFLSALLRALHFRVDTRFDPPSEAQEAESIASMARTLSTWSDDQLSRCLPHGPAQSVADFIAAHLAHKADVDVSALYVFAAALTPSPRVYLISVGPPPQQPSLEVIKGSSDSKSPCVVLYHLQAGEEPHVEAVGWKRGTRGPSPVKTLHQPSDAIIRALDAWYSAHASHDASQATGVEAEERGANGDGRRPHGHETAGRDDPRAVSRQAEVAAVVGGPHAGLAAKASAWTHPQNCNWSPPRSPLTLPRLCLVSDAPVAQAAGSGKAKEPQASRRASKRGAGHESAPSSSPKRGRLSSTAAVASEEETTPPPARPAHVLRSTSQGKGGKAAHGPPSAEANEATAMGASDSGRTPTLLAPLSVPPSDGSETAPAYASPLQQLFTAAQQWAALSSDKLAAAFSTEEVTVSGAQGAPSGSALAPPSISPSLLPTPPRSRRARNSSSAQR